jgi:hypothetical protein
MCLNGVNVYAHVVFVIEIIQKTLIYTTTVIDRVDRIEWIDMVDILMFVYN